MLQVKEAESFSLLDCNIIIPNVRSNVTTLGVLSAKKGKFLICKSKPQINKIYAPDWVLVEQDIFNKGQGLSFDVGKMTEPFKLGIKKWLNDCVESFLLI